jgi:hypothetical protein
MRAVADPTRPAGRDPRAALAGVARALPWLGAAGDSAEAHYYAAQAHHRLGDVPAACAALRAARPGAAGTRLAGRVAAQWAGWCEPARGAYPYD